MRRIRICCLLLLCAMLCSACGNSAAGDNARQLNPATETQPEATDPATGETTLVATPLPVTAQKPVLQNGETYTGLPALALQDFAVEDPENTRGLSTEKVGYSYGVAKDGAPHETSVQNQSYFSENGYQAFCLDTVSEEKTLYLTFDCGYENGYTEMILDTLKEKNVPAAFFCTLPQVEDNPQLIARMITEKNQTADACALFLSQGELTGFAGGSQRRVGIRQESLIHPAIALRAHNQLLVPVCQLRESGQQESASLLGRHGLHLIQGQGERPLHHVALVLEQELALVQLRHAPHAHGRGLGVFMGAGFRIGPGGGDPLLGSLAHRAGTIVGVFEDGGGILLGVLQNFIQDRLCVHASRAFLTA